MNGFETLLQGFLPESELMRFVSTGYAVNNLTFLNQEKIDRGSRMGSSRGERWKFKLRLILLRALYVLSCLH